MDRSQLLLLVALLLLLLHADLVGPIAPPPPSPPKPNPARHRQPQSPSVVGDTMEVPDQKPGVGGIGVGNAVKIASPPVTAETLEVPEQKPVVGGTGVDNAVKIASPRIVRETLEVPEQKPVVEGIGFGSAVTIRLCSNCGYSLNAMNMKKMLETEFPGIDVEFAPHPTPLTKLAILTPIVQAGVIFVTLACQMRNFPRRGMVLPRWYQFLILESSALVHVLGFAFQYYMETAGAFEIWCNDELVFSKLKMGRFPGDVELKDLIAQRLADSRIADMLP